MKLKDLQPNDRNPRYITEPSFDALIDSLLGFPEMLNVRGIVFTKTKTGKKGVIFGANQRFRALLAICEMSAEARAERIRRIVSFSESINKLSVPAHQRIEYLIDFWTPIAISREVPAKWANDVTGWTPEQIEEFTIRDNVPSGAWDMDLLANEWAAEGLGEWGLDLPEFGQEVPQAEDDGYEMPDDIETDIVPGDLFEIGEHRLLCGDSTDSDSVAKLMNGKKADMVFTDPPYLMDFTGGIHADGSKSFNSKHGGIKNDKMSDSDGDDFLDAINSNIILFCKGAFYISFYRLGIDKYFASMKRVGLQYRALIIWNKGNHTLSNSDYMSRYEPIFYGWVDEHNFYGGNNGVDIWDIERTQKNDLHPTMKPIPLCEKGISDGSLANGIVLDLFLGSGSTMVAAHQLNRKCYGMEIDPKYCQVIIDRMLKLDPALEIKRNGQVYETTE